MGVRRLRIIDGSSQDAEKSVPEVEDRTSDIEPLPALREKFREALVGQHPWILEQIELHGEEEPGIVVGAISSTVFIAPEGTDPEDQAQWVTYYRRPAQMILKQGVSLGIGTKVLFRRRKGKTLRMSSLLVRVVSDFI